MAYLEIERVGVSFKDYVALDGLNLEINKGEFVSLIGHSGCGKSTLLNLIAGLNRPTSGRLTLDGKVITSPGADRGMVFQHHGLLPWLSVWSNVYEAVDAVFPGRLLSGATNKRDHVERLLRLVGLWEHRKKKPGELSGGMRQRVAVARAFSVNPKVLLLDEPFGALDALTKATMHDELERLWSLGGSTETVVMVTHDIDEAIFLSDRIVVMTDGPGARVREIVPVALPRPRDKRAMVHMSAYADIKDRLLELLTAGREAVA